MNQKKLEETTIGKLQQDLKVPAGFSWAELESGIKRPVEKPKRTIFIYLLALVLGVLIIAILYTSDEAINNSDSTLVNTSSNSSIENHSKEDIIRDGEQENRDGEREIAISESANTNNYSNYISKDFKLGKNTGQKKTKQTTYAQEAQIITNDLPLAINNHRTNHAVKKDEKLVSDIGVRETIGNSDIKTILSDVGEPKTEEILIASTKYLDKLPQYVSKVKSEAEYLKLPNYKMEDKLSNISVPSKWIVGVSSGLNVINYRTSSSLQGYSRTLDQVRSKRFGYSLGLNASYQLSDRFAVYGAIEHHLSRERIEYIHCDTIQIIQENVPVIITINELSGNSHTTFGIRSTTEVHKRTIRENNQYSVTEASLGLSYVLFSKKDVDLRALGGFGMARRQTKGKFIDSNLAIIELSESNFLDKKSLSSVAILGLRLDTDINQKLSFNWGFTYRRHLTNWTPIDEIIIRPSTLNLDVGFRMKL